jgi:hypothetical protein
MEKVQNPVILSIFILYAWVVKSNGAEDFFKICIQSNWYVNIPVLGEFFSLLVIILLKGNGKSSVAPYLK